METPINYDELTPTEICTIIEGLRAIEAEGLRKTAAEQSFIVRNISSPKLVAVARLIQTRNTLANVLSGSTEGR